MSEIISIDPSENELKEKLICQYYFGGSNCSPKDFINRKLDLQLIDKISTDTGMTWDSARTLVLGYIANYVSWVNMTAVHYKKTEIMVKSLKSI